eukprot:TRINITY_DN110_c0_g2_i1.p1 TRINITY_DN110_c0_g2~~TRINITY_DN110_c0_g2_i1.p1  ORF type:complete len:175 (+),score=63.10 TRINITY_DN110_c0_g2_i1:60-527(+)
MLRTRGVRSFATRVEKHVPRVDRRRPLLERAKSMVTQTTPGVEYNAKGHRVLTEADKAKMDELRRTNPASNTQRALARRFGVSRLAVAIAAPAPPLRARTHAEKLAMDEARRVAATREARKARRKAWARSQLDREHARWAARQTLKAQRRAEAEN